MRTPFALCHFVVVLFLAGCGSPDSWTLFESPEGSFRVELPGPPKQELRDEALPGVPLRTQTVRVDGPTCSYAVSYRATPEGEGRTPPSVKDRLVAAYAGKVLSEMPVSVGEYVGTQWELALRPRGYATVRTFTKGERVYELIAVGDGARAEDPDVRRFLDSFRLVD